MDEKEEKMMKSKYIYKKGISQASEHDDPFFGMYQAEYAFYFRF